jgi:uncharacterized membrane protein
MSLYLILKFTHIFLALVAVGFNLSYGIWIAHARREPEQLRHVLQGIRVLDNRFANPSYALLLLSGLGMIYLSGIPLTTFWIAAALVLYVVVALVGIFLFAPTFRRQIAILETQGAQSLEFQRLSQRSTLLGIITTILVVIIVGLMVFKPTF